MRALPCVTSIEASGESMALELLDEAMELAPRDPLPISIAAWCHGLRAGHHFTWHPDAEKVVARELVPTARLNSCDALAETMLAAGYTLAHDLEAAAVHAERTLALDERVGMGMGTPRLDQGLSWTGAESDEEFLITSLAPVDPLNFLWSVGVAAAEFQMAHYDKFEFAGTTARWQRIPASTWTSRFLPRPMCWLGALTRAVERSPRLQPASQT